MRRKILVTAIGSFSALSVISQLRSLRCKVVGCDINRPEVVPNSLRCDAFYTVPKTAEKEKFFNSIKKICRDNEVDMIFPLTDVDVDFFDENRDWFEKNDIIVCISSKETIKKCRDKYILQQFVSDLDDIDGIPSHLGSSLERDKKIDFPIVCKPRDGRSSEGLIMLYSDEEFELRKNIVLNDRYIVEPFVGGSVVTVDVIRGCNTTACFPRLEIKRTYNGAGLAVQLLNDEKLINMSIKIADALDIKGCVNFEFIKEKKSGKYYFMECNPRFSGGVAFSSFAGYKIVKNHIRSFMDKKIDGQKRFKEQYIVKEYTEIVTRIV